MVSPTKTNSEGKKKSIDSTEQITVPTLDTDSASESESLLTSSSEDYFTESDSDEDITPEYLKSLLDKARQNYAAAAKEREAAETEEEIITLDEDSIQKTLPQLDPGPLPPIYLDLGNSAEDHIPSVNDPEVESVEKATTSLSVPEPPAPPPELTTSGKSLTKKQRKELKNKTAGPDWFDLPAPDEADLPRLHQEVEALRLRNQLDPKRFYRKDEGEGKGAKGLPKYFAIGTIIPSNTPFGTASGDNLPRAHRKRTLVDELVDDAEAKRYAKRKFEELQSVRGAKGKNTLHAKKAMRRPKW